MKDFVLQGLTQVRDAQEEKLKTARKTLKYYASHPTGGINKAALTLKKIGGGE
jgi:hypothetical protein